MCMDQVVETECTQDAADSDEEAHEDKEPVMGGDPEDAPKKYTEPETTYQTLVDDVQIHHTQYPVLQAIANLYLNKQITFHTC